MRDYQDVVFERKEYKASLIVDTEIKSKWKQMFTKKSFDWARMSVPVSVCFATAVIGVAVANRFLNDYVKGGGVDS
jgi:hypothetical protein